MVYLFVANFELFGLADFSTGDDVYDSGSPNESLKRTSAETFRSPLFIHLYLDNFIVGLWVESMCDTMLLGEVLGILITSCQIF